MSWLKSHRKAATLLSLASLAFTLLGQWAVGDWWKARQRPQPVAIWIEGARAEVSAGTKLRLTARTSPAEHLPDTFIWSPADRIEGNGQSVILDTESKDRQTEYLIEVGLVAFDNLGYPSPKVTPVIIKVVPPAQLNSKPEWQDRIQMEGSPEVRSGSTVRLEALAVDKDGDKLNYSWSIESKSVEVEGNGTRKVLLKLPREFAKRSNVTSIVKLNISDGFPDHEISDFVYLTVTPLGRPIISRKSAKQTVPASGSQAQPQEAPADKPTAAVPLASPTSSQSPNKPNFFHSFLLLEHQK